jgi:hypothetical protein
MRFKLLLIIGFLSVSNMYGQSSSDTTYNIIYIGGGRQGATYVKYERLLMCGNWTQTIVNFGFGGVPGDSDPRFYTPRHNIITSEIGQLFGYKVIFLEIGIEPAINFYGKNTYTDINAILGLRYQSRTRQLQGLFFQLGYNPRLYYSCKSDIEVPFYFGLGLNF